MEAWQGGFQETRGVLFLILCLIPLLILLPEIFL